MKNRLGSSDLTPALPALILWAEIWLQSCCRSFGLGYDSRWKDDESEIKFVAPVCLNCDLMIRHRLLNLISWKRRNWTNLGFLWFALKSMCAQVPTNADALMASNDTQIDSWMLTSARAMRAKSFRNTVGLQWYIEPSKWKMLLSALSNQGNRGNPVYWWF